MTPYHPVRSLPPLPKQTPADTIHVAYDGYDSAIVTNCTPTVWTPEDPAVVSVIEDHWTSLIAKNPKTSNGALVN